MVNSVRNEHQPPRTPARLVVSVLLLGTFLSWWGTRDSRHLFGEPSRQPILAAAQPFAENIPGGPLLLARGSEIQQRECAGCHESTVRSVGPSYREIVSFYRRQSAHENGKGDLLSALAAAVTHPQPGWANFPPAPPLPNIPLEDRVAVASWILNLRQNTGTAEGPGK